MTARLDLPPKPSPANASLEEASPGVRVVPLGGARRWTFLILASERGLVRTHLRPSGISRSAWEHEIREEFPGIQLDGSRDILDRAEREFREYLAGERTRFEVPLDLEATGTPFQREVWQALLKIPHGEAWTYGRLAQEVGRPGGARAVGQANGKNPIPVLVPCHRVIGSGGALGGFTGGLEVKRFLLDHEGVAYRG